MNNLPFENIKIIDLSTVLAGPSVAMFFAELGAEVIKIENPSHPDVTRSWKLPAEDKNTSVSAYFSSINYKKQYIQLDFNDKNDYQKALELIKDATLVIMNYKKGGQEKLNLSDELLHQINPQLIIGKINGFGSESDRVAYDLILQAETGFMSMNGNPSGLPTKMPVALIDVLAAHQLKQGVLIQLLEKERTTNYKGKVVIASLYESAVSSLINQASNYLMSGTVPRRMGSMHPNIAPYGELFTTKDNKIITFAIGTNRHFIHLCNFLKINELIKNPNFSTVQERVKHREELAQHIQHRVKSYVAQDILNAMYKLLVPCGEIKDLAAVFNSPEAKALIREESINGIVTKRISSIAFKTQ